MFQPIKPFSLVYHTLEMDNLVDVGMMQSLLLIFTFTQVKTYHTLYFRPSTMIIWYPNPVLTSAYLGLPVVLASSSKATFSNAGSRPPRVFHPSEPPTRIKGQLCYVHAMDRLHGIWGMEQGIPDRSPGYHQDEKGRRNEWYEPCRALSSENSRATSSNLVPLRSFSRASSFLACFSHWGWYYQFVFNFGCSRGHNSSLLSTSTHWKIVQETEERQNTYKNMAHINRLRTLHCTLPTLAFIIRSSFLALALSSLGVVFRSHGGIWDYVSSCEFVVFFSEMRCGGVGMSGLRFQGRKQVWRALSTSTQLHLW